MLGEMFSGKYYGVSSTTGFSVGRVCAGKDGTERIKGFQDALGMSPKDDSCFFFSQAATELEDSGSP